ncbi:MAG: hypothetical protein GX299_04310 [Epulopiscium sp.]|nr:hypothetical protein [Candidatus Epulonipiscium sp.]
MGMWLALASAACCITGLYIRYNSWKIGILFRFFDGLMLAFLCFSLLPVVLEEGHFAVGVAGILLGVLLGAVAEQKTLFFWEKNIRRDFLHSASFFIAVLLGHWHIPPERNGILVYSIVVAFFGGLLLFIACGGILPEDSSKKNQLLCALGGFIGFILGVFVLF